MDNKRIENLGDTIIGEINRICVTTDMEELKRMFDCAKRNLDNLVVMCHAKIKEVTNGNSNDSK